MWARLVLLAASLLAVAGQSSNVAQCIPSYSSWVFNAKGQSPCVLGSYLESACGTPTTADAIPNGTHYLGPSFAEANPCRCSMITYSVMSACGGCQGRSYTNWTTWTVNCVQTFDSKTFPKPIPDGTAVPPWAFADISLTNNNFDPVVAAQIAGQTIPSSVFTTESQTTVGPATQTSSSTTSSSSPTTSSPSQPTAAKSGGTSHSGVIAGAVVGGLVALAIIFLLLLRYYMKRRQNQIQKNLNFDSRALVSGSPSHGQSTMSSAPIPSSYPSPYPMSEYSAMPTSPMTSAVYTHLPGSTVQASRRSIDSDTPSVVQLGSQRGTGTPLLQPVRPGQTGGYYGGAEI